MNGKHDPFSPAWIRDVRVVNEILAYLECPLRAPARGSRLWRNIIAHDSLWQIICNRDGPACSLKVVPATGRTDGNTGVPTVGVHVGTYRAAWIQWMLLHLRIGGTWRDISMNDRMASFQKSFLDLQASWDKVLAWDAENMPELVYSAVGTPSCLRLGSRHIQSLGPTLVEKAAQWDMSSLPAPILAWFSCVDGQTSSEVDDLGFHTAGQMGGFSVYGEYVCSYLATLGESFAMKDQFDFSALPLTKPFGVYSSTSLFRFFAVDLFKSNNVIMVTINIRRNNIDTVELNVSLLEWWATFADRLQSGYFKAGKHIFGSKHPGRPGIDLFPRAPPDCVVATTAGIRVEASTIYSGSPEMGFIYSIRMMLVDPVELMNHLNILNATPATVGVQLLSRHWIVTQPGSAAPRHVRGLGVVGNFPILVDKGFYNIDSDGEASGFQEGWFIYQSLSGWMPNGGSFGGEVSFKINTTKKDIVVCHPGFRSNNITGELQVLVPTFNMPAVLENQLILY